MNLFLRETDTQGWPKRIHDIFLYNENCAANEKIPIKEIYRNTCARMFEVIFKTIES